jgi:hypothetical protein
VKNIFFGPRPQVCVAPAGPSFELSSIFFDRPTKHTAADFSVKRGHPTSPLSRDMDPQTGGIGHVSKSRIIFSHF